MAVALLFPAFDHAAIEERYASWSTQTRLARTTASLHFYDPALPIAEAVAGVDEELCLVITDPLVVARESVVAILARAIGSTGADVAVPVTNESDEPRQIAHAAEPYLTMRQFEDAADAAERSNGEPRVIRWESHDPGVYLARTAYLDAVRVHAARAAAGTDVALAPAAYVHRWSPMRSQERLDLLGRIPAEARSILELGCAEGVLGAAVKDRQRCRYVGIELDAQAASIARKRLDDVYTGDVEDILDILDQHFDWIIAGDVLEHLADPWTTLAALLDVSAPGGRLLLSIPNASNWAIIADLLRGRLDYTYIGIACAGHLRFFTRRTIAEALEIAGWEVVSIEPMPAIVSSETETLIAGLRKGGIDLDEDDLLPTGFYVTARNPMSGRKSEE